MGFGVAYVDYPAKSLSTLSAETIFANIERGMTTRGWTVLASRDVSGRYPGHEITMGQGGDRSVVRAWIDGDREYEVGVRGELPDAEAFLDSFRIVAE